MAIFPMFQLPLQATKLRFKEPFLSAGLNTKFAGIVPVGIYRGFTPNPQPNFQLFINTDGAAGDSVAVIETSDHFNLTVRYVQQVVLDFAGQPLLDYPLLVVIRAKYSLVEDPFNGSTDAKVLAVKPTLNNADPLSLNTGDIIICSVTGIGGGNVPTIDTSVADNNGGPLPTQQQTGPLAVLNVPAGSFSSGSNVPVQIPSSTFSFKLKKPSTVAFDIYVFAESIDQTGGDNQISVVYSLQDLTSLVLTDVWQTTSGVRADDSGAVSARAFLQFTGIKRSIMSLPAGNYSFGVFGRVTDGPGAFGVDYPLSVVVTLLG